MKTNAKNATRFRVTYEIVTEESAENGEAAFSGFLPRSGDVPFGRQNMPENPAVFTLRQVSSLFSRHYSGKNEVEADVWPVSVKTPPRWVTFDAEGEISIFTAKRRAAGVADNVRAVSLSVHFPREISPASAVRVARLFGIRAR